MNKSKAIRFLRVSYWVGAIFDALLLIPMFSPKVASAAFGIPNFNPKSDYRYAIYIAAALMVGWASLLIWADRRPLERRGVLLLTIVPVLTGLIVASLYDVVSGFIAGDKMLLIWIIQGILVLLFGFSYVNANKLGVV